MFEQEPKVEFVQIDLKETITTSNGTGGGQRCVASMEQATGCEDWVGDVPWMPDD